ncbi:MAG: hypothetical protein NT071_09100, partial [Burkholderiales bacterium]|nr:hypothetical protein [Burkholderiales bacterium]
MLFVHAGGHDHGIELAVALLDDFTAGAFVVGEWIAGVAVLVEDVGVGDDLLQPASDADVALGRVPGRLGGGADDLGAER